MHDLVSAGDLDFFPLPRPAGRPSRTYVCGIRHAYMIACQALARINTSGKA